MNTDTESLVYLMLANHMLHKFYPFVITVAEVDMMMIMVTIVMVMMQIESLA